jgi:hypothetical protein
MPGKARRAGPYSRRAALANLDKRTREGTFAREVRTALIEHVGGKPTAPQMLLIQLATLKALRIALLSDVVAQQTDVTERNDRQLVSWMNSLRRDLETLGLARPAERIPGIRELLLERAKTAA